MNERQGAFFLCSALRPCQPLERHHGGCPLNPFHRRSFGLFFFSPSLSLLLDKDLQLPSGFNCNFDFPEEACGWMYDHAKWLRSTWASSTSPDDRTFPGKPAAGPERSALVLAFPTLPSRLPPFPAQSTPLPFARKPPQSSLTTSPHRTVGWWFLPSPVITGRPGSWAKIKEEEGRKGRGEV